MKHRIRLTLLAATALTMAAATSAMAQEGETIRIGAAYPLTGPAAFVGELAALGHEMMVDKLNAEGGILGRQIESFIRDSQGTPADATQAARDLITLDNVDFLVGGLTSAEGLAISEVALQEEVIYIAAIPKTVQMSEENFHRYMFRTAANTNTEGGSGAIILDELGAERICTILFDYAYGHDLLKGFEAQLERLGSEAEIVAQTWPALNVTDYTPYITEVMGAGCDGVFAGIWGGLFVPFAKQADSFGLFDQVEHFVGAGEIASQEIIEELGDDMPTGVWGNSYEVWYYPDTPEHNEYVEELRQRLGIEYPPSWPITGYMAMQALAAGIEAAGSTDPDAVIEALEGLTYDSPIGPQTIRESDHQANRGQFWGEVAEHPDYDFKILDPVRYIPADDLMD
jgi:branched-chain amino acid transport system substrate-binding protein